MAGGAAIFKGWGEMTSLNPWETTHPTPIGLEEDHPLSTTDGIDRFAGFEFERVAIPSMPVPMKN
jgi:hypothetical protein